MSGLDDWIAHFAGSGAMGLVVAVLLGLRHATDPDHLTAVSTLVLADRKDGARRAGRLGLASGLGHATTLFAFGLPVVLFRRLLPEPMHRLAELAVGLVIVGLALRLLVRWRRGCCRTHPHTHGGVSHAHPHVHEASRARARPRARAVARRLTSLVPAFGVISLLCGVWCAWGAMAS